MVHERIAALRERIKRREQRVRADRQASARRVEQQEPEGVRETAQVRARQASEEVESTTSEARQLASDAKTLIATELGISRDDAGGVIEEGAGLISDLGDRVDQLDLDGDGDTDILEAFDPEEPPAGGGGGSPESVEAVAAGGDVEAVEAVESGGGASEPIFDPFEDGPK